MADSTTAANSAQQAIADGYAALGMAEPSSAGTSPQDAISQGYQLLESGWNTPSAPTATAAAPANASTWSDITSAAGGIPQDASPTSRFVTGLTDLPVGAAQLEEHVAETPLNWLRSGLSKFFGAVGASNVAASLSPVSTQQFDQIVANRQQQYEQARTTAGEQGIDWWRLGGQLAASAPLATVGGPASTVAGRLGQTAALGAAQGALQPSTSPGNFWLDKIRGTGFGAGTGVVLGGLVESVAPALRWATNAVRTKLGVPSPGSPATAAQADQIVNRAMQEKGVDPKTVNLDVLAGMKREVQDALSEGGLPNAASIVNRAKAESLPVPVRLMRGQATGDPMLYSTEQNLRGIQGVGAPITARLQEQNQAFIANLDALGAKNAPDPVETSQGLSDRLQGHWDALEDRKNALYAGVRNNQGQTATLNGQAAGAQIRLALDTPQASHAWLALPTHLQKTADALADGTLPLSIGTMQALDKAWSADARAADGTTRYAINTARQILNDAPLNDPYGVGEQARQAYQAARAAHAQQMSLIDPKLPNGRPNPNFQPLMKAMVVDGKPPETLFKTGFMEAAPSVAAKNLAYMSTIDPNSRELVGKTLMGEIKRVALSGSSDERGAVSQSTLNSWAREPVKSARLEALEPSALVRTFKNLADVVEAAKRAPVASTVNTSNTGSAVVNAATSALKAGALEKVSGLTSRIPVLGPALNAKTITEGLKQSRLERGVEQSLRPGVTLKALPGTTLPGRAGRAVAERGLTTGAMGGRNSR